MVAGDPGRRWRVVRSDGLLPEKSASMARILILVHERGSLSDTSYFLSAMSRVWTEQGHSVVEQRGPAAASPEAEIAFLHVDLTRVDPAYIEFLRRYPRTVNLRTADISKRVVSRGIVQRGDGYDGPVIVKTNANCGGLKESSERRVTPWGRLLDSARNRLPWSMRSRLNTAEYRVIESVDAVPLSVWRNHDLVVERFEPEIKDGLYCLRTWVFCGDRETSSICYARDPIVKSHTIIGREALDGVPDEIRVMRRALGFEFGKFDYVLRDGRVVLFDANRTPSLGDFPPAQYLPRVRILAEGLESLLQGPSVA